VSPDAASQMELVESSLVEPAGVTSRQPPAVEARGLGKTYRVYKGHGRGWLQSVLLPFLSADRFSTASPALRGIDLTVERGEILGILGRNGSGKTTLLKVLAGMTQPTAGEVRINGYMRCMMGSGVGFNARLSGRENIVFGSIAMGIPRGTAEERMDSIIDFAELEEHIDTPTQYYSKGMRSRLALAAAARGARDPHPRRGDVRGRRRFQREVPHADRRHLRERRHRAHRHPLDRVPAAPVHASDPPQSGRDDR